jgi:WD40 repeat protein
LGSFAASARWHRRLPAAALQLSPCPISCKLRLLQALAPFLAPEDTASLTLTRLAAVGLGKDRAPINAVTFLPDQPRIFTGSSAGDISVWTTTTLGFERYVQAHNFPIQVMRFNRNGTWMVTGDNHGGLKYWDSSLTANEDFRGHRERIGGIECVAGAAGCLRPGALETPWASGA